MISPDRYDAVIFDTDGVVTDTASVHAAAWKRLFDEYLAQRVGRGDVAFAPFDTDRDYRELVDGKPRYDGVRSFLTSRDLHLPEGDPTDGPGAETVCGLGNAKDGYFRAHLDEHGVDAFATTVTFLDRLASVGIVSGVVSASRNARQVLRSAGVLDRFAVSVDGTDSDALGLAGKPDPALFLEAARRLTVDPDRAVVVEDALAGVEAGRHGSFALVIGVDRTGHGEELRAHGADVVVRELDELAVGPER